MHPMQGRTYLCKKLDLSTKVAVVRPADLKYYTKTRDFTDVHVIGGRKAFASHNHVRRPFHCQAAICTAHAGGFAGENKPCTSKCRVCLLKEAAEELSLA